MKVLNGVIMILLSVAPISVVADKVIRTERYSQRLC